MAGVAEWMKIEGEHVTTGLLTARDRLEGLDGDLVLDWSHVSRVDVNGLSALDQLAGAAREKNIKLVFRGVNIDVYRVLKLANLSDHFSFVS